MQDPGSHDPYLSNCQEETLSKAMPGGIRPASAPYQRVEITFKVLLMGNLNAMGVYKYILKSGVLGYRSRKLTGFG